MPVKHFWTVASCVFVCSMIWMSSANAADPFAEFGLADVELIPDEAASEVRGQGLLTRHFGLSITSGVLYDPDTGSSLKAHSLQITKALDADSSFVSTISWSRIAGINSQFDVGDFTSSMQGSVFSNGFAIATF